MLRERILIINIPRICRITLIRIAACQQVMHCLAPFLQTLQNICSYALSIMAAAPLPFFLFLQPLLLSINKASLSSISKVPCAAVKLHHRDLCFIQYDPRSVQHLQVSQDSSYQPLKAAVEVISLYKLQLVSHSNDQWSIKRLHTFLGLYRE
jgi:hypothetical protein